MYVFRLNIGWKTGLITLSVNKSYIENVVKYIHYDESSFKIFRFLYFFTSVLCTGVYALFLASFVTLRNEILDETTVRNRKLEVAHFRDTVAKAEWKSTNS